MNGIFFNEYPYTDFHELNLSWVIKMIIELNQKLTNFININTIKYADPIDWKITSQYEANTVVIDPQTFTAYLSTQPVPSGVIITNTDYWTPIFDLSGFIVRAAKNFTTRFEAESTLIATFPSSVNDWVVWGDVLYRVTAPIAIGDYYVIGTNLEHFTMEEILGHIEDLHTINHDTFVDAINELDAEIGNLSALTTDVTNSLVGAINSGVNDINFVGDRPWIYVDSVNGDDNNDGSTQATALKTLDAAINRINKGKIQINIGLLAVDTYDITRQTLANCSLHIYNYSSGNVTVNFTKSGVALYRMHINLNGDPNNEGHTMYITANYNSVYWDGSDCSFQHLDTTGITGTFGFNGGQCFISQCRFSKLTVNYSNVFIDRCTFYAQSNNAVQGKSSVIDLYNFSLDEPASAYENLFFFTASHVGIQAQAFGFSITNKFQYMFRLESCTYCRGGSAKTNFLTACTNTPNEFHNFNNLYDSNI